ncbi:hypothetical protein KEH51_07280 [[Brevibacterium] frigoritolerans]|uniref:Uncharacterized protein n=1 Tax=Peribacillus frigoritolerans TaxID=450367 RepID=A0A941FJC2_9BACI|nr:hypothetical protein [Peribacillus frigoritolerans]
MVLVLLMAQAVIGIMMYVDGSGNEPMNRQAVMGQPAYRSNTTDSDDTENRLIAVRRQMIHRRKRQLMIRRALHKGA